MRKALYILGILDDEDADWMARSGEVSTFEGGTQVVEQGLQTDNLYIVLSGRLSVLVDDEVTIADLACGDIVGEMSFIDSDPPSASVVVHQTSQILAIPKSVVAERLNGDQAFAARFYRALAVILSDRLRTTIARSTNSGGAATTGDVQELDEGILDNIHIAGDRMRRLLDLVNAPAR